MGVSDTSIQAYHEHGDEGKIGKQCRLILSKMREGRDYSRREMAKEFELELSSVCGRVNELVAVGLLEELESRPCKITNKTIHPVRLSRSSV
jgi:hypothetical protein